MMKKHYRVIRDNYCGYEVQAWRWWFPIWIQCWGGMSATNTHTSVEAAEDFAKKHAKRFVVKNLGAI